MNPVRLRAAAFLGLAVALGTAPVEAGADVGRWLLTFAGRPSRYLGSPGHRAALDEVARTFRALGFKGVRRERFTVVAPVERLAHIDVAGAGRLALHGLWPNHVQLPATTPDGIVGPLLDGGHGEAEAMEGRPVSGAIVLVRLPCARDAQGWLTPFVLGAAAVVFLPPEAGGFMRAQAEELFLDVPADLPRFWAEPATAARLRGAAARGARATIVARMAWKEIETENVIGVLPGSKAPFPGNRDGERPAWRDRNVVLQAYTDSMSIVPALAPGADEAGGLIALMELAAHFAANPVPPTLTFLASSGHGHALSGAHEFVARHVRRDRYFSRSITGGDRMKVDYFVGLDLSSGDDRVASFSQGAFYLDWETNLLSQNALAGLARLLDRHAGERFGAEAEARYLNGVSPPTRSWKDLLGFKAAFDAEAATYTGTPGLTFMTPFDTRPRVDTPLDTPARVRVGALSRQIETLSSLLSSVFADPECFADIKLELPDTVRAVNGEVHEFERTVTGLPDKLKAGALMTVRTSYEGKTKTFGSVRTLHAVMSSADDPATEGTDETGLFRFPTHRYREYWKWVRCMMQGYVLDDDGRIVLSPDMGPITSEQFPSDFWFTEREKSTLQVLIPVTPYTILEPVNARQLRFLDRITIQDGRDQPFMNYAYAMQLDQSGAQEGYTPAVVVFVPELKGVIPRVKALFSGAGGGVESILTGADEAWLDRPEGLPLEQARGLGYPVAAGRLTRAPFEAAKDVWLLNDARGRTLKKFHVRNLRIENLHRDAGDALVEAREAWTEMRYADFLASARRAWGLESRAYPEYRQVANDLVKTVVFFCVLLLPFAFCMERLFFAYPDLNRQLLATCGFFVAGFLALREVHPAFKISSNPLIIFLAFIILALGVIVLGIIISKFQRELRRIKGERGDYEATDISRMSATMAALLLGLSNLRRRPMRTALTVVTVIVLTFTVLSMVSMSSTIGFFRLPRSDRPPYAGALVRESAWQVLQPPVEAYLRSELGGEARIVPRSWVIARTRGEALQQEIIAESGARTVVSGLLGLSADERHVLQPQENLHLEGAWFASDTQQACLLPRAVAERLGVGIGSVVRIRGIPLEVIGLFDGTLMGTLNDLDGEPVTPARFALRRARYDWEQDVTPPRAQSVDEGLQTTEHLAGDRIAVVPHRVAMSMEGRLRSIAVVSKQGAPPHELVDRVKDFLVRSAVMALVSDGRKTDFLTSIGAVSVKGAFDLLLPICLVGLIVLNTMMGSVHERTRDISIFSSVGLAPMHIGALFVAEAFVVAVVGVVLGYLLAQTVASVLLSSGSLSGLSLNYSSSAAVGACLLVILAVMLSTLYPAHKASELSVPDVTRQWKLPEPKGGVLDFDFPFTVGEKDLVGLFAYLASLFRAYRDSSIGSFACDRVAMGRTADGAVLTFTCWLAPYDLGISQRIRMEALPMNVPGLYRVHLTLEHLSGERGAWHRQNRGFLTALRKRFLVWRMFGEELKARFTEEGRQHMSVSYV